nr:MAG TPA: hypothetical protein [Caudoviricetes sp.]
MTFKHTNSILNGGLKKGVPKRNAPAVLYLAVLGIDF